MYGARRLHLIADGGDEGGQEYDKAHFTPKYNTVTDMASGLIGNSLYSLFYLYMFSISVRNQ